MSLKPIFGTPLFGPTAICAGPPRNDDDNGSFLIVIMLLLYLSLQQQDGLLDTLLQWP
jgi:hypothetical protein